MSNRADLPPGYGEQETTLNSLTALLFICSILVVVVIVPAITRQYVLTFLHDSASQGRTGCHMPGKGMYFILSMTSWQAS